MSIFDSLRPPDFSLKHIEFAQKIDTLHNQKQYNKYKGVKMTKMLQNSKNRRKKGHKIMWINCVRFSCFCVCFSLYERKTSMAVSKREREINWQLFCIEEEEKQAEFKKKESFSWCWMRADMQPIANTHTHTHACTKLHFSTWIQLPNLWYIKLNSRSLTPAEPHYYLQMLIEMLFVSLVIYTNALTIQITKMYHCTDLKNLKNKTKQKRCNTVQKHIYRLL